MVYPVSIQLAQADNAKASLKKEEKKTAAATVPTVDEFISAINSKGRFVSSDGKFSAMYFNEAVNDKAISLSTRASIRKSGVTGGVTGSEVAYILYGKLNENGEFVDSPPKNESDTAVLMVIHEKLKTAPKALITCTLIHELKHAEDCLNGTKQSIVDELYALSSTIFTNEVYKHTFVYIFEMIILEIRAILSSLEYFLAHKETIPSTEALGNLADKINILFGYKNSIFADTIFPNNDAKNKFFNQFNNIFNKYISPKKIRSLNLELSLFGFSIDPKHINTEEENQKAREAIQNVPPSQ